jgi:hypothetical protein
MLTGVPIARDTNPLRSNLVRLAPALVVTAAIAPFGWMGITDPLAWLFASPWISVAFVLTLQVAPVLLFWLVPASMPWFTYLPLLHYEALVVLLAGLLAISALFRRNRLPLRLEAVEIQYLLFLLAATPGLINVISLWRYIGALKLYVVGLLGFEVARRGAARLGREAMLWGPAFFCLITLFQVVQRVVVSGVPSFKTTALRTYLTDLPWGHANGVASVVAICMPAMLLLVSLVPRGSVRQWIALGVMVSNFVVILWTGSRGVFLLLVGYILLQTVVVRRSIWITLVVVVTVVGALMVTPVGKGLALRFVGPQATQSLAFRAFAWQMAWTRGISHFPVGIGAGQGLVQNDELQAEDPHDFVLTLFSELGVIATLIWIWMFVGLFRRAWRMRRWSGMPAVGGAMMGTLGIECLNMLFDPTLNGNLHHLLFWWLIGIYYGVGEFSGAPASDPVTPRAAPSRTSLESASA